MRLFNRLSSRLGVHPLRLVSAREPSPHTVPQNKHIAKSGVHICTAFPSGRDALGSSSLLTTG
jgi:hypothetical protein